jgi:hypothetical protein
MWRGHLQEGCAAVKAEPDTPIFDTSLISFEIAQEVVLRISEGTAPSPSRPCPRFRGTGMEHLENILAAVKAAN